MPDRTSLAVVLAAGEGTRMRSARPKVMHEVAGLPMLGHVLAAAAKAGIAEATVVVGNGAESVRAFLAKNAPTAAVVEQTERLGTAHAVLAARESLAAKPDDVLVLYGDTPLVTPETLGAMRQALADGADIVVLGFRTSTPTGYGRLIEKDGELVAIREEKDATPDERAVTFCNAGLMGFRGDNFVALLDRIGNENAKGEYYLTDAVEIARRDGRHVVALEAPADEVVGVNTRVELAAVERLWQDRARRAAMLEGATLIAPETIFLAHDTRLGRDVVIEPHVVFGPGVVIEDGALIHGFCHIEGSRIAGGSQVGPFARLRPGSVLEAKAKVGNFVELKNTQVAPGAKVNHLSYIGDASVGAAANIGAGTITCNYDGYSKSRTTIGAGAFIGSNSALVAPVVIGEGAYIASGSVITEDVAPDALALGRARQVAKPGWAAAFRARARNKEKAHT